jgi:SAM-dependent methyltransferase
VPFLLPPTAPRSDRLAAVLAFGETSVLEACAVLSGRISGAEVACPRILTLRLAGGLAGAQSIAGIHKLAVLISEHETLEAELDDLVQSLSREIERLRRVAVSGYCMDEAEYEDVVQALLTAVRDAGLRKVRLLRPSGNELKVDQLLGREALDFVAFKNKGRYLVGPTSYVRSPSPMRERGTKRPSRRPEISLSPRLARTLVNISGVPKGATLLDPFCGAGTVLVEGMFASLRCIGVDSSVPRLREARENMRWASRQAKGGTYRLELGDARDLEGLVEGQVDAVVTEPILLPLLNARPSMATAHEMFERAQSVYADSLGEMSRVLKPGGRMVVVVPTVATIEGDDLSMELQVDHLGLRPYQPGPIHVGYPVPVSFESTRWVKRAVYAFESRA